MGFPRIGFVGLLLLALVAGAANAQSLPGIPMGATAPFGKSTASLDGTYLRLDTSNDPITGTLTSSVASGGTAIELQNGAKITIGAASLTNDSGTTRLITPGVMRADSGFWIGGVLMSLTTSGGLVASASSAVAWVRQNQTAVRDARLIGNTASAGQVAGRVGTQVTDAGGGAASTLLALCTDCGNTTSPTDKWTWTGTQMNSLSIVPQSTATYSLGTAAAVWTTMFAKTVAGRAADGAPLLFADDNGYQFTDDGATNTWFAIGATGNLTGFQAATGTARYIKLPGEVAATITKPTCNSAVPGIVAYLDDSNDADSSHVCICAADSAGVYTWEDITFLKPCDL